MRLGKVGWSALVRIEDCVHRVARALSRLSTWNHLRFPEASPQPWSRKEERQPWRESKVTGGAHVRLLGIELTLVV